MKAPVIPIGNPSRSDVAAVLHSIESSGDWTVTRYEPSRFSTWTRMLLAPLVGLVAVAVTALYVRLYGFGSGDAPLGLLSSGAAGFFLVIYAQRQGGWR